MGAQRERRRRLLEPSEETKQTFGSYIADTGEGPFFCGRAISDSFMMASFLSQAGSKI